MAQLGVALGTEPRPRAIESPSIALVHDGRRPAIDLLLRMPDRCRTALMRLQDVKAALFDDADLVIFDADLTESCSFVHLREGVLAACAASRPIIVVATGDERCRTLASQLPAHCRFLGRPLKQERLDALIGAHLASGSEGPAAAAWASGFAADVAPEHREALAAGSGALDAIFLAAQGGRAADPSSLGPASDMIVGSIADASLAGWIESARKHHDATYQHCLLVAGIAAAFGLHVGFGQRDLRRLTVGCLLHDLGKVHVPVEILNKPGALDEAELAIMREHPLVGARVLSRSASVEADMIAVVRSHHELLDGSGYPDGLMGTNIPDIVRVTTIADIFAALIEERAYKKPMTGQDAHASLMAMGGRLDQPLVRSMRGVIGTF